MLVQDVAVFVQNLKNAPRSWTVSYSFSGLEGPFQEFAHTTQKSLVEGEVSLPASDGGVVAARYWKIEITSNWGADEVELREVRLLGRNNADLQLGRRLEDSMEITVDGSSLEASDYVLKYTFSGEAPLYVPGYRLAVVRVNSVDLAEGETGNRNTLVVGQPKTFSVSISNHENYENDLVKYVEGTDCSAEPFGQEFPLSSNGTFTVIFYESTESRLTLCYRMQLEEDYEPEDYFMIPGEVYLEFRDVYSLTAVRGANDFAVKGVPKVWRASVLGSSTGDMVGFQINGECVLTPYVESGFTFTFDYDSVEGEEVFPLCYRFYGEPVTVFPKITVRVGHVDSLEASSGSANVLITNFEKNFIVTGSYVASGDQLFLTSEASCTSVPDYVSSVSETLTTSLMGTEAGSLFVCYKFAEEPFYLTSVVVNVYDVTITAQTGASDVLVVDQEKQYDIAINGTNANLFSGYVTLEIESCAGELLYTSPMVNTISVMMD